MKLKSLEKMRCPLCGSQLSAQSEPSGERLQTGSVACDCRRYPVVDGILVLNPNLPLSHILAALGRGDVAGALVLALALPRGLPVKLAELFGNVVPRGLVARLPGENPRRILKRLGLPAGRLFYWDLGPPYDAIQWEYMRHRFASDSYFAAQPLLSLAALRDGPLLDVGCGHGHYSFALGLQRPRSLHYCLDADFLALLIAKRFFAPQADFVHVNADLPLPFDDGVFDVVLESDMLHYSRAKMTTGAELGRVLSSDGLAILPHVHNAAQDNPCPGTPLTLDGYRRALEGLKLSVFAEGELARRALGGEPSQPLSEPGEDTLRASHAFAIIASHRSDTLHGLPPPETSAPDTRCRVIVNPVYETATSEKTLSCRRRELSTYFWDEYPISRAHFPEQLSLGRSDLADPTLRQALLQRFFLVSVPPDFVAPRPEENWLTGHERDAAAR